MAASATSADLLAAIQPLNTTDFPAGYTFKATEVMTDVTSKIIGIFLPGRKLKGAFPDLSNFTDLKYLDLSNNQLDTLTIAKLPKTLVNLELYRNKFTVSIPNFSTFTSLVVLDLSKNGFTGFAGATIPSNIKFLYVNDNKLTALPASLGSLVALNASNNSIVSTGFFPLNASMVELDLSNNGDSLEGFIDISMANSLQYINISGSKIKPIDHELFERICEGMTTCIGGGRDKDDGPNWLMIAIIAAIVYMLFLKKKK
jgi:Leucine-rich repeat (LRR) protein